ncbi:MAG: hypothetical protein ACK4TA_23655 [Saprospiraceae bacterium]
MPLYAQQVTRRKVEVVESYKQDGLTKPLRRLAKDGARAIPAQSGY